jgi:excisionase family DNA binding protein
MERLLNIREAAKILNVTETTIRRWTNAGNLPCYRIGGKQERRFKPQDLQGYIESGKVSASKQMVSLGFWGLSVPDGAHITYLSLDTTESLEIAPPYVFEGLNKGETVLLVAPAEITGNILRMLEERGADADNYRRIGKLHLSEGKDNPASQMEHIMQIASAAGGRFRVFGDMTWTKIKGWSPVDIRKLEELAGRGSCSPGNLLLCQYSLESFSGSTAMMAIETHDYNIYKGDLTANPYYNKRKLAA